MQKRKKKYKIYKKILIYLSYFILFSLLGSFTEYIFGFMGGRGIAYDQFIYYFFHVKLFFIPFYGLGGLILILFERFMDTKKIKFIYRGLLNAVIITFWELIGGLFSLEILKTRFWDYSTQPFNFMGIISLKMSLYWILLGYVFSFIYRYVIRFLNQFLL
jgi:uncharacterized membrane protein